MIAGGAVMMSTFVLFSLLLWFFGGRTSVDWLELFSLTIRLGSGFGILASLWYGGIDLLSHGVLRQMLWLSGRMPLNLGRFLDHATHLIFLRKVGGGYIFIHPYLQDYFASLTEAEP